ncbi:hypothetical protein DFJ74DRAFT_47348 [Hyaloraphidium curvatum]|nr:hypothetical protein DFJ74DRAFT_47348 [Hyaloraphidium curvatum]
MASRADTSSGDEHLDALLHVLGALKEEAAPVGLQEYREQVAQLRPLVRTIGTKFLVRDGSRLAVEGLAPVTTALKLIEYAIVKRPGILVGVPDAGKEGMETTGESQRGTLGEEPSLAFCDWVVRTLASLLAEDLPAVVIEQAQAVLVKVFLVLRDNLRDFAYLRRTLSAMLEWCRGSQESLLRYRQKGTVLYAAALAPWGGLESVEAIAIRSSSAATAFCGSLMSLMAQVLPPLWRGVGAVDAVADALLAMVVPDTFPNQESETGTVGFLRLLSSLFRAMDRSEVPLFVVDELLLKLWELAYGLSVSETDVPKRVQLEAASTMDHALRFVGKPQLDVIGPTLEATVGAMRRSCLESALKARMVRPPRCETNPDDVLVELHLGLVQRQSFGSCYTEPRPAERHCRRRS